MSAPLKKEELKISNVQKKTNILQMPIYSMTQFHNHVLVGGGGGNEIENAIKVFKISDQDLAANKFFKETHSENTGKMVANYMDAANGLNVIAVCLGNHLALYKFHVQESKLSLLQKFQSDFALEESYSNYLKWSRDNGGIVVAGEDRVIRLYKVKDPKDFTVPLELVLELKGGHHEPINALDISPAKTYLISTGGDCQACVWDLRQKRCVEKLTFRDGQVRDRFGNPDPTNFMTKGCLFSPDSKYIYLLASKSKYKTFVVKYSINPGPNGQISFLPVKAIDVHDQAGTGMRLSRDGAYLSVNTCDGFIKIIDQYSCTLILSQKRHNLPTTSSIFITLDGNYIDNPSHVVTVSADYTYNMIPIPSTFGGGILSFIFGLIWQIVLFIGLVLYLAQFLPGGISDELGA